MTPPKIVPYFFKEHMMVYLDFAFVSKQAFGLNKCKQIMESKFLVQINNFLKYELQNSPRFLEWLECKVLDATSNLTQWL
jgi:hypothetical protein